MVNDNEVEIEVTADTKDADKSVAGLRGTFKKFEGQIKATGAAMTAFGVATVGLAGITVKFASDLNESINAVNVVFGDASKTILDFGETASRSAGLANAEFLTLATQTGSLLQNFGFQAQEAADRTTVLAQRAADMASVFNTDVKDALFAINAALRGETEPIRRFAIDVTDATLQIEALAQGITKSVTEMSISEKVTLRLDAIMRQSSKTQGDFENTSNELANSIRILKADLINFAAQIGQTFIPIVEGMIQKIRPVLGSIIEWTKAHPDLTKVIALTGLALGGLALVIGPLLIILPTLIASFTLLGGAVAIALGPIGLAAAAITAFGIAYATNFLGIRDITNKVVGFIVGLYQSWFGWFLPGGVAIKAIAFLASNWKTLVQGLADGFAGFVNFLLPAVNKVIDGLNFLGKIIGRDTIPHIEDLKIELFNASDAMEKMEPVIDQWGEAMNDAAARAKKVPEVLADIPNLADVAAKALEKIFEDVAKDRRKALEQRVVFTLEADDRAKAVIEASRKATEEMAKVAADAAAKAKSELFSRLRLEFDIRKEHSESVIAEEKRTNQAIEDERRRHFDELARQVSGVGGPFAQRPRDLVQEELARIFASASAGGGFRSAETGELLTADELRERGLSSRMSSNMPIVNIFIDGDKQSGKTVLEGGI